MLPEIRTTEPNSPTARANPNAAPETMAGTRFGRMIRRNVVAPEAPSEAAASSISRSSSSSTGCTARTEKGSVTNRSARTIAARVPTTLMPAGLLGPKSPRSVIPATIVGSAKGRSMSALTTRLPGNWSRTRTQATSVPATALSAATPIEQASVSFSAATAGGAVTASQNAARPPSVDLATTAARGSRTMTLSQSVEMPRPRDPAPARHARRLDPPAPGRLSASLVSGDPRALLDLGHRAGGRVEEVGVDLVPAADVADGEQAARRREAALVLGQHGGEHGPVAPLGEDLLRGLGHRVVHEGLGLLGRLGLRRDGDRVLDQDRLVGDRVVDVLALLLGRDRLVLVGEQDVAGAGGEGLQRLPTRLGLDLDVAGDELLQVADVPLLPVAGQEVPLRGAGRERVGRHDLHAGLEEVRPGLDVLRVPLAGDEDDDRLGDEPVRRRLGPVGRHEVGLHEAVDVGREREGDDVGGQPALDR